MKPMSPARLAAAATIAALLQGCGSVPSSSGSVEANDLPADEQTSVAEQAHDRHDPHAAHHSHHAHAGHDAHQARDSAGAAHAGHAGHGDGHAHSHADAVVERGARLEVSNDARHQKLTVLLGPIALPAARDGVVMKVTPGLQAPLGHDGWMTGVRINIEDAAGNVLPDELIHHVNVILPERRDLFRPMMQRLAAAGRETRAMGLPWPLGLRFGADEPIMVVALLHNESMHDYGDVYVRLTIDAPRGGSRIAVQPFMMDVSPPPDPASWDLPPGWSRRSWEASPAVDGRLIGLGAHMHRYGHELILEDVTTGRVLYRNRPVLDAEGEVVSIPRRKFLPLGLRLRASHTYRVTAVYHNPTDRTIVDGAMGVFGGVFRPSGAWPELDPEDAIYLEDRRLSLR
jgi:hypothetical protein